MQLEPIISALRARCPSLASRVAGAAQFKVLPEAAALPVPCAYVIPLDDNPQESMAMNSIRQVLKDSFAVVVAVSNVPEEKGQSSASAIHNLRAELWAALLGWRPGDRYDGITYEGGQALGLDRARLWYQFEFGALMEIEPGDGWEQTALGQLPHFDGATVKLDAIDPADANRAAPVLDGRYEAGALVPKTGSLD